MSGTLMIQINKRYHRIVVLESVLKDLSFSLNTLVISLNRIEHQVKLKSGSVQQVIELLESLLEMIDRTAVQVSEFSSELFSHLRRVGKQALKQPTAPLSHYLDDQLLTILAQEADETEQDARKVILTSENLVLTIQHQLAQVC